MLIFKADLARNNGSVAIASYFYYLWGGKMDSSRLHPPEVTDMRHLWGVKPPLTVEVKRQNGTRGKIVHGPPWTLEKCLLLPVEMAIKSNRPSP